MMFGEKFRIVLSGNLINGFERGEVEKELALIMKLPLPHARKFLQGRPTELPTVLEQGKAERVCKKLSARGIESYTESVSEEIPDIQDEEIVKTTPPPTDEMMEKEDPIWIEEEILQPAPDELEMVESLDLDLDLTSVDSSMPQSTESIVVESNLEEIVEPPIKADTTETDEESGQFFEQLQAAAQPGEAAKSPSLLSNRKLLLALSGLTLVVLLSIAFVLLDYSSSNNVDVQKQPGSQPSEDRETVETELTLSREHVDRLSRQVRLWMIQYSSGDPTLVALDRLQQDLTIPAENMIDGWGIPLRYEPAERSYTIRSAGPDRAFMTEDDLVKKSEIP